MRGCGQRNIEAMEHTKKWHPVRDATKSVIWKIRLLFQRETDAFHCFTNGSFVNVITCHGSYTTLKVNGYGLHTCDSADDFLGIGANKLLRLRF